MLDATYRVLAEDRESLRKRASELLEHEVLQGFKSRWRALALTPKAVRIGGEDGSINHRRFKSLLLYVVNATGLVFSQGFLRADAADIGFLHPYHQVEERLQLYRSVFELKVSLEVLDRSELFLVDGSLISDLKAFRTLETGLSGEEKDDVISLLPELERRRGEKGIVAQRLYAELDGEAFPWKAGFLEYLEYLSLLERLLSKGMGKVVGVSKASTRSMLGWHLPDNAIFEEVTSGAGYSTLEKEVLSKRYPAYDEFFRSLVFTVTHVRLEEGRSVFTLEFPWELGEDELVSILERMSSMSVEGYPYILRKAHQDVVIRNTDMERIVSALGILGKTGREVLG